MGDVHREFWWEDLREEYHLENQCLDGRIKLKWVFKKCDEERGTWSGLIWLRIETGGGGSCICGTKHSGAIRCGKSAPWI
jgi:hypothetical protein